MKLGATLETWGARFDALSMRERVLSACAVLVALFMIWTLIVLDPMSARRAALLAEQASFESMDTLDDPLAAELALAREQEATLRQALAQIDTQLAAKSAGLIAPERMVQVIQELLANQRGIKLLSLHNKPVSSLISRASSAVSSNEDTAPEDVPASGTSAAPEVAPFMHPVELVIEGTYLDILAYLRALEALEWRFYWQVLELESTQYPLNRVRIELSTLSMDKDWLGV